MNILTGLTLFVLFLLLAAVNVLMYLYSGHLAISLVAAAAAVLAGSYLLYRSIRA